MRRIGIQMCRRLGSGSKEIPRRKSSGTEEAVCFSSAVSANTEAVTRATWVQLRTYQGNLGAAENLTEMG